MKRVIAAPLILLTLIACSRNVQPTPAVTEVPTQVESVTPVPMPLSPSQTPESQLTAEWEGIPIMPGAIAGEGDEEGYVFTIRATAQQVQEYYQLELGKLGWQPSSQESSGSSVILNFSDSTSASIHISILSKGDQALVLLMK